MLCLEAHCPVLPGETVPRNLEGGGWLYVENGPLGSSEVGNPYAKQRLRTGLLFRGM